MLSVSITTSAQDSLIGCLSTNGHITYIDNNWRAHFTISFKGDTVYNSGTPEIILFDSSFFSIRKNKLEKLGPITAKSENDILTRVVEEESKYIEENIFLSKLDIDTIQWQNKFNHKFIIWYYKVPFLYKVPFYTDIFNIRPVSHQIFITFLSNEYYVTLSTYVFEIETLEEKINFFRNDISNAIQVYYTNIAIGLIEKEFKRKTSNDFISVSDTTEGYDISLPPEMNYSAIGNFLQGAYRNKDDSSTVISLFLIGKEESKYNYFAVFQNFFLSKDEIKKYELLKHKNERLVCYEVLYKAKKIALKGLYIFFETKSTFGVIMYSSDKKNYDEHLPEFQKVIDKIKLKPL